MSIVQIDPVTTTALAAQGPAVFPIAALDRPGRVDTLGPGDVLSISIFEVGVTLFTGTVQTTGSFNPSAHGTTLADVIVDSTGHVQLPYIGRLSVVDKTTGDVEHMIETAMVGMSQRPQAIVTVKENAHNVFYVSGDVRTPGRLLLTLPQERLLDALARAGGTTSATGPANQPDDMVVRFTRDGKSAETRLSEIDASGPQNIALLPGDRIELFNRPRTFLVFGSTDKVSQVAFGARDLSLAEALARIGGPSVNSADPAAVYLFRYGPPAPGTNAPTPMIYRLNMMRADSYFLSQQVQLHDKDIIYISSAAANAPAKLAQIIGQFFSPFLAIRTATQ